MGRNGFSSLGWTSESRHRPLSLTHAPHLVLIYRHDICFSEISASSFLYVNARCRMASREAVDIYDWWRSMVQQSLPAISRTLYLYKAFSVCQGISVQVRLKFDPRRLATAVGEFEPSSIVKHTEMRHGSRPCIHVAARR